MKKWWWKKIVEKENFSSRKEKRKKSAKNKSLPSDQVTQFLKFFHIIIAEVDQVNKKKYQELNLNCAKKKEATSDLMKKKWWKFHFKLITKEKIKNFSTLHNHVIRQHEIYSKVLNLDFVDLWQRRIFLFHFRVVVLLTFDVDEVERTQKIKFQWEFLNYFTRIRRIAHFSNSITSEKIWKIWKFHSTIKL